MPLTFRVYPSDLRFAEHAEAGDPECLCSRCVQPISEEDGAIYAWPDDGRFEIRFHAKCFEVVEARGTPS